MTKKFNLHCTGKYKLANGRYVRFPNDLEVSEHDELIPHSDLGRKTIKTFSAEERDAFLEYVDDQQMMFDSNMRWGWNRTVEGGDPIPC